LDLNLATHLTQQVRLFEAVASTTPDFIYVFDTEGRFQYANRRLLEVWGLALGDVVGKTCLELGYEPWHHEMHMREIAQVVKTREAITGEVPFRAPRTGIFGVYEYIFTPVLGVSGEVELIAGTTRDVSERKRVEEALRTSEERLAIALQAGQLGFWDWDVPSGAVIFGGCWASMLGYSAQEIDPDLSAWERLVHPEDRDRVMEVLADHLARRTEFYECEHRLRHKDGSWRWILDRGMVVERDADGTPLRALGTHLDITARKQAEEDQRRSADLLRFLSRLSAELAPLATATDIVRRAGERIGEHFCLSRLDFCMVDEQSSEVRVLHEWLSGTGPSGAGTHRLSDYLDAKVIEDLKSGRIVTIADVREDARTAALADAYARWNLVSMVYAPHLRADRLMLLVLGVDRPRVWREDEVALIGEVAERVHIRFDRARAEAGLRESESFYRQMLESIPGMTFTNTPDGACDYVSSQWVEYTGVPAAQHHGSGWIGVLHPRDRQRAHAAWQAALAGAGEYDLEYRVRRRDGVYEWFKVRGRALRDESGGIARWMGTAVNVDGLKRAETALQAREARYRELFEHNPHPMWIYDAHSLRFLAVNDATLHLYGYSREEFAQLTTADIRPPEEIPRMLEVQSQVLAGYTVLGEWLHRKKDGTVFHVETRTHPLLWEGRRAVLAMANDITERKRAEAALRDSDRQKDEFIAMLAHELRNPLAPIRASAGILRAREGSDPVLQRSREIIDRQAAHMARLLDDLLDVSRLSRGRLTLQRAAVPLREILEAAIETSRPLIDQRGQRLELEGVQTPVLLYADAARLTQVFANLLNNASKYNHPGGCIALTVHDDGSHVLVRVRDSGIGIEPDMLEDVFDLFVQGTHARAHAGGGLGIGLSLARRLVDMHCGTIVAQSAGPGSGSTFTVRLPTFVPRGAETLPQALIEAPAPARRKILIADDNEDAADSLALLFESQGCTVRTAYGGEAAVREAQSFHPDVILLDLGMPEVDGYQACRRIRESAAGAGALVIAVSGWGRDADLQRSAAAGFDRHFLKPVDPNALLRLIGEERRSRH